MPTGSNSRSEPAGGAHLISARELAQNGRSALEDWAEVLRTTKDDPNKEAALRLNLGIITADEIVGFKLQKKLVATDLKLEIRPRAGQARS